MSSPEDGGVRVEVIEAVRGLYAGPPDEFTAERERLAREAKDAGERGLAQDLRSLKRPVVAAWAVNLLVREEADLLAQVLDIGDALRAAQEGLEGDALRELGRQRRQLISSVVSRARELVVDHGGKLNAQAEQQVAATLQAALADQAAAQAVLTGLLVKPLESTGLGSVDLADHVATAPSGTASVSSAPRAKSRARGKGSPDKAEEERRQAQLREQAEERRRLRREAAQERVADAEQALQEAERSREEVREQHEEARAHVLHLEARIDELRRQLSDLESQAEAACEEVETREQQVVEADDELDDARREADAARAALAELG